MPLDYSQYLNTQDSWRELYNSMQSYPENILRLTKKILIVEEDYYPVITSYLLCNSVLCRVLPILFMYGQKGTGKSTLGIWASKIHGIACHASSDTYASIRNDLQSRKMTHIFTGEVDESGNAKVKAVERPRMLILDDVDDKFTQDKPDLYRMLKTGYDRSTSIVSIAGKDGENLRFDTFSAKIISSTKPIHLLANYSELQRRMLLVNTKRIENFTNLWIDASDLLEVKEVDWTGFPKLLDQFWSEDENVTKFITYRKELGKKKLPLSSNQRVISLDLMATGLILDLFNSTQGMIDYWEKYWQIIENKKEGNNPLLDLLKKYIDDEEKTIRKVFEAIGGDGLEYQLDAKALKMRLKYWSEQGWLDTYVSPHLLASTMQDLGYKLYLGKWIRI